MPSKPTKPTSEQDPGHPSLGDQEQLVGPKLGPLETLAFEGALDELHGQPDDDTPDDQDDDQEDDQEDEQPARRPRVTTPAEGASTGLSPEMAAMMAHFSSIMADRDERLYARFEERLANLAPKEPTANGAVHYPSIDQAEMAAAPGQYPPSMTMPLSQPAPAEQQQPRPQRMVAFIPKEDPYNPRQTTFKTWLNGRELRSKRGQVMILTLGHGIDLAKNGHGNCVDIAAMQGAGVMSPMQVQQQPDYARPNNWDGLPLDNRTSVPL